jgi:hypothetical protein
MRKIQWLTTAVKGARDRPRPSCHPVAGQALRGMGEGVEPDGDPARRMPVHGAWNRRYGEERMGRNATPFHGTPTHESAVRSPVATCPATREALAPALAYASGRCGPTGSTPARSVDHSCSGPMAHGC